MRYTRPHINGVFSVGRLRNGSAMALIDKAQRLQLSAMRDPDRFVELMEQSHALMRAASLRDDVEANEWGQQRRRFPRGRQRPCNWRQV